MSFSPSPFCRSREHGNPGRSAFTLIELLIVIAIIAILSIVVVLTLAPAEMLRQSRDATRLSDMDTLNRSFGLYVTDMATQGTSLNLGNASTVYVSLIDSSSTCGSLGLPALPAGYTYHCGSATSSRNTDGNGWLPVSLKNISSGSPLGSLPVDPQNSSSSGLYYTYVTNGSQYELTSLLESQKYKTQYGQNPQLPNYPEVLAQGSNLTISPLFNPNGLVGYWPMDEGSGTVANDLSGSNNIGNWNGNMTNGSYYIQGKAGGAGNFDGSSTYVSVPDATSLKFGSGAFSISVLVKTNGAQPMSFPALLDKSIPGDWTSGTNQQGWILFWITSNYSFRLNDGSTNAPDILWLPNLNDGNWHMITVAVTTSAITGYVDGAFLGSIIRARIGSTDTTNLLNIGRWRNYARNWLGSIDDVRIYNRALSAAEVQALYNAEK